MDVAPLVLVHQHDTSNHLIIQRIPADDSDDKLIGINSLNGANGLVVSILNLASHRADHPKRQRQDCPAECTQPRQSTSDVEIVMWRYLNTNVCIYTLTKKGITNFIIIIKNVLGGGISGSSNGREEAC